MVYAYIYRYADRPHLVITDPVNPDVKNVPFLDPDSVDQVSKKSMQPMERGYPVDPAAVPKSIQCRRTAKSLPDTFKCRSVDVVTPVIRDIIERFEPGVHQFLPVDFYRPKETEPYTRRYWMVVCQRIDSADATQTTLERYPSGVWQGGNGKFVFSRAAIGSAHLWRDPWIAGSILCSQALGDALTAAKLKGLYLQPLDEV